MPGHLCELQSELQPAASSSREATTSQSSLHGCPEGLESTVDEPLNARAFGVTPRSPLAVFRDQLGGLRAPAPWPNPNSSADCLHLLTVNTSASKPQQTCSASSPNCEVLENLSQGLPYNSGWELYGTVGLLARLVCFSTREASATAS